MITFNVVKETHGWSIRMGQRMSTPFWSKDQAVRQALILAEAIGRHGQTTEVIVEGEGVGLDGRSFMAGHTGAPLYGVA
ncbi:MAG: hypothetical protein JO127_15605 [Caulobacteraceae bacterium]|nr:hypothetical protein [Caulobacteraceae bacterium]